MAEIYESENLNNYYVPQNWLTLGM